MLHLEQLCGMRFLEEEHCADDGERHFRKHVQPVVAYRVDERIPALGSPACEKDNAAYNVAYQAHYESERDPEYVAGNSVLSEQAGKTQHRERYDVIECDTACQRCGCKSPAENGTDTEQKLRQRVNKRAEQSPLAAVHDCKHADRQHTQERHRSSQRHFKYFHHAERGGQSDHNSAHGEFFYVDIFIFRHIFSPFYEYAVNPGYSLYHKNLYVSIWVKFSEHSLSYRPER